MSSAVQSRLPGVINIVLALWLLLGSFIGGFGNIPSKAGDVILGFFLAFLSMHRTIPTEESRWMSLFSVVIGGAVIASPFVFNYSDLSAPTTNNIIIGVLVVVVSAWGFVTAHSESAA